MPLLRFIVTEIEWYSAFDGRLLATILLDETDQDYGFVVLGRDERRLFRAIDMDVSHPTPKLAREALARRLSGYAADEAEIYPQGDVEGPRIDLFGDHLEVNRRHPNFQVLATEPRYEAGRNLIAEIANSFIDNDGNYELEFQSENFHSRLWELYLHVSLHNAGLKIVKERPSPDFEVEFFGEKFFIEAVTVNPSQNERRPDLPEPEGREEVTERLNDFMPIKFGSALFSKLQKRYWELEHVAGKPLIIAVHDYHTDRAMTWSRTALSEYLYGIRTRLVDGEVLEEPIENHEWEGKVIPSGFFGLPDSEWISGVLFSNQATIPKFNRMGRLAGLGCADVKMWRRGFLYNPDPTALEPIPFSKDIDDPDYEESWSDGLVLFHNPNARHPVDRSWLLDISHITHDGAEGFVGYMQPYDVLSSITVALSTRPDEEDTVQESEAEVTDDRVPS